MTPKTTSGNVFFDHWQDCLRAHFVYVLRIGDHITEPTLREVLLQTGLTEDDFAVLYDEADKLGPLDPNAAPVSETDEDDFDAFEAGQDEDSAAVGEPPAASSSSDEEDDYAEDDDFGSVDSSGQLSMF